MADMVSGEFFTFNKSLKAFDDPFVLYSDSYFPDNMSSALELCRYLWYLIPTYRRASQRVARHFITEFDFPGKGDIEEKDNFKDFIKYQLKLKNVLLEAGDDERCYGQAFYRIHYPFDRFLIDNRESLRRYALSDFPEETVKFNLKEMVYEIPDPLPSGDKKIIKLKFVDLKSTDKNKIKLRKLDPRNVAIKSSSMSGSSQIIYRFDTQLLQDVKNNNLLQINNTPKDMLEAISKDQDFLFAKGEVFHLKGPCVSGISYYGWALPEPIANFRSIHQFQIYRKADEAVGMDYILPFRLITPEATSNVTDVMNNVVMSKFTSSVKKMISTHRIDKTAIHSLPFAVGYQEFSGNGKAYTQKDMMEYHSNELLEAAGYPVELFKSSLQIQQVPTAIRLFENQFWHIYDGYNSLTSWAIEHICNYLNIEAMEVVLQRPSIADNIDKQNILLQMGMQGELPRKMYMSGLNINDPEQAVIDRFEEDIRIEAAKQKKQIEFEKYMNNSVNAQVGNNNADAQQQTDGVTPNDIESEALIKAEEWLSLPIGERRKAMDVIRNQNINLYSLAKQFMEQKRAQGEAEGRQQVNQQAQQT